MKPDSPIVAEVRRARAKIAARFGYDLHRYCQYLMRQQVKEANLIKAPQAKQGRRRHDEGAQAGKPVASRHGAKASVRRVRKSHAVDKNTPWSETKRPLGV